MKLGDPAGIRDRHPAIVNEALLDELVAVPTIAELLAYRDRNFDLTAQGPVDAGIFRTDQVLNEIRIQRFDKSREADRVGEIQPGVKIDGPVAVLSHALADLLASFVGSLDHLAGIEGRIPFGIGNRRAERAKAGLAASMTNESCGARGASALIQKERESHILQIVRFAIHSHDRAPHFRQRTSGKNLRRAGCTCAGQKCDPTH